ncbi:MAG: hypothetical protein ABJB12_08260 [Pseudomonadota bacterium]
MFSGVCSFLVRERAIKLNGVLPLRCLALLSLLLCASSCKPGVGSSCDSGAARCVDRATELACQGGRYIQTPCHGAKGCEVIARGINCDFSGNKAGDPCSTEDEGAAACANNSSMLACHGGQYILIPCRGAAGCVNGAGRALCDTSIAQQGDVCRDQDSKACADDRSQVLVCKQHTMQRYYLCRGPGGCVSNGGKLSCDTSVAKEGDACDKKLEGQAFACSTDVNAILVCKGGAFAREETCKSGQKCTSFTSGTRCAEP